MVSEDKLTVKVVAGYHEIVECDDQLLCAQIIGMIAERQKTNPKSAEEILIETAQEEAEKAKSDARSAKYHREVAEKKLKELTEKLAKLAPEGK